MRAAEIAKALIHAASTGMPVFWADFETLQNQALAGAAWVALGPRPVNCPAARAGGACAQVLAPVLAVGQVSPPVLAPVDSRLSAAASPAIGCARLRPVPPRVRAA